MIKRQVLLIASISGIFGIMMGVLGTAWVWMQTTVEFSRIGAVAKTEANIVTKVDLLEDLRSGRYNDAAMQLEVSLDKDLIRAAESARDGGEFGTDTLNALAAESRARRISGYAPVNANAGAAVQEAFRLAPQTEPGARATPIILQDDER